MGYRISRNALESVPLGDITPESIKGSGKFWDSSGVSGSQPLEYLRVGDDEMTLTGSQSDRGGTAWVVTFKRLKTLDP